MKKEIIERQLSEKIDKWTAHMKWRSDYKNWKNIRIWQEKYQEGRLRLLNHFTEGLKNKKMLEIGCGMGGLSVILAKKGCDITALDFNLDYLEITKLRASRYNLNLNLINSTAENLPFNDKSFDIILCYDVLEHTKDPYKVIKEISRVLKPEGQVYITIINKYGIKDVHYKLYLVNWMPKRIADFYIKLRNRKKDNKILKDSQKLSEMHYFSFRRFLRIADKSGFDLVDLILERFKNPEKLVKNSELKQKIKFLKILKLNITFYKLLRLFYLGSFNFMLTKRKF
jgi:ubiquinone biosynthesis O-methyltransferase